VALITCVATAPSSLNGIGSNSQRLHPEPAEDGAFADERHTNVSSRHRAVSTSILDAQKPEEIQNLLGCEGKSNSISHRRRLSANEDDMEVNSQKLGS
jgi:hypothetical protein